MKTKLTVAAIIAYFITFKVTAQNFGTPLMPTSQPSISMTNYGGSTPLPNPNGQVRIGATAQDIMNEVNSSNPYNRTPGDNRTIQQMNNNRIMQELQKDPAYNQSLRNGVSNNYPINKQQELFNLLQDIVNRDNQRATINGKLYEDYNSQEFAIKTRSYTETLKMLQNMLSGKEKLSLADSYFAMENAHGEAYLTKVEFKSIINQSADFIKQWMQQNKLSIHDNASINYAVQQFMGEELTITKTATPKDGILALNTVTHKPFQYDFNDYTGDKDHRNFFVTKCLATGTGQCNSLPAVYLCLVEALGGTAYLALAPQHSLIKYPDKNGNIRNYEPTSHWDITNEWYWDNMFVSKQAAQNRVYLDPWNKKQIVADIALQLSFGYFRKYGGADGKFLNECVNTAKLYFPKNNNLILYFTLSNLYGNDLLQVMRKEGIQRIPDIHKSAEAQKLFERWQANEAIIEKLGYQDQPKDMYAEMMKYHEFRGRIQQSRNFDGKQKRSLFINSSSSN